MSKSRKYRTRPGSVPGDKPRKQAAQRLAVKGTLWRRCDTCLAVIAADLGRMGEHWADVHERDCPVPWQLLGLPGPRHEVYPASPWTPPGVRLRAVNRR